MIDFVLSSFSYIIIILRFWDYGKKISHEEQKFLGAAATERSEGLIGAPGELCDSDKQI